MNLVRLDKPMRDVAIGAMHEATLRDSLVEVCDFIARRRAQHNEAQRTFKRRKMEVPAELDIL